MALLTRNTLKNLFKRGSVPTEVNFADFIDSTVNKVDDGFAQSNSEGWMLAPQGSNQKLISFFETIRDPQSAFSLSLNPDRRSKGLSINMANKESTSNEDKDISVMFFRDNGYIGINNTLPNYRLDVSGMVAMEGRVGTFKVGAVPADGRWQPILTDLEGVTGFEVIAQASGLKGRGRYAISHAIALGTFGTGTIQTIKASYGWFFQKIRFRWRGGIDGYRLEVKTSGNYGFTDKEGKHQAQIRYYISKLWDNSMLPQGAESSLQP